MNSTHEWKKLYRDAILETDRDRLPVCIRVAHAAIDARIEQLRGDGNGSSEEKQAIEDALAGLRVLERETEVN